MVCKEARALSAIKKELTHGAAVIAPQLLHQLREKERHLLMRKISLKTSKVEAASMGTLQ